MKRWIMMVAFLAASGGPNAFAGVPDLSHSGCAVTGQTLSCGFRFGYGQAGTPRRPLDILTLKLTVRDQYEAPLGNCLTSCTLTNASVVAKSCSGDRRTGVTNANGVLWFVYPCIGGRGTVDLRVTASTPWWGDLPVCSKTIRFMSTDLDGSRDTDGGATSILDLGIFATHLPPGPYGVTSDFNCDGQINVVDLGIFAGGIGRTCADCP